MATYTDNFGRANQDPIAGDWATALGVGVKIESEQIRGNVGSNASIVNAETFDNIQSAQVTFATITTSPEVGVLVRGNLSGNGYVLYRQSANLRLRRIDAGTETSLATIAATIVQGDNIRLEASGSTLKAFVNNVQVGSDVTDATYASGKVGIYAKDTTTRLDDFVAEGLAATASIVDIDTDNTVTDGQQNVSLTTTGFASDITTVNLKVGADTLALTGLTGTGDNYTFDLPDVTSYTGITAGLPFSSGTYQNEIQVGDGTDTAVINITREPKTGYAVVEVVNGSTARGSIFETRVGGAPADGSQFLLPPGYSATPSGLISGPAANTTIPVWDVTSKNWDVVTVSIEAYMGTYLDLSVTSTGDGPLLPSGGWYIEIGVSNLNITSAQVDLIRITDATSTEFISFRRDAADGSMKIGSNSKTPGNGTSSLDYTLDDIRTVRVTWTGTILQMYEDGAFVYSVTPNSSAFLDTLYKLVLNIPNGGPGGSFRMHSLDLNGVVYDMALSSNTTSSLIDGASANEIVMSNIGEGNNEWVTVGAATSALGGISLLQFALMGVMR